MRLMGQKSLTSLGNLNFGIRDMNEELIPLGKGFSWEKSSKKPFIIVLRTFQWVLMKPMFNPSGTGALCGFIWLRAVYISSIEKLHSREDDSVRDRVGVTRVPIWKTGSFPAVLKNAANFIINFCSIRCRHLIEKH